RQHREPVIDQAEATATLVAKTAVTEVPDAEDRAVHKSRPATTTTAIGDLEPTAPASPQTSTSSRPKSTASKTPSGLAVPAVTSPGGVQTSTREGSAAPSARPTAPLEADVAATLPTPAEPETPVAPFFETKDVNESPRIETRVEPRVPEALRARSSNEIVVV